MLGAIVAGLKFAGSLLDVVGMWQRWRQRQEDKQTGMDKQKMATLEAREGQASDANAIDESVRRLSDADLDAELRGKPKPGS
jgi:endo-alpha-1,4-polygalactosaminidase (GH114 family)